MTSHVVGDNVWKRKWNSTPARALILGIQTRSLLAKRIRLNNGFDSETRYRFLADNMTDLIMLVGANGKRLYVSAASKALLGYEPEEMLAIKTKDAIHPDDAPGILKIKIDDAGRTRLKELKMVAKRARDQQRLATTLGRSLDVLSPADS